MTKINPIQKFSKFQISDPDYPGYCLWVTGTIITDIGDPAPVISHLDIQIHTATRTGSSIHAGGFMGSTRANSEPNDKHQVLIYRPT